MWEIAGTRDFMERFEDLGLKIGTHIWLDQYMKTCEYKRSRSLLTFDS